MNKQKIFSLGFFDGVHLGHVVLLDACRALAEQLNMQPAAITFDRHPMSLFATEPPALISTNADRKMLLTRYGMEQIVEFPVTEDIMSTTWRDFLHILLAQGAAGFVCGSDFRFGHKGEGNVQKLSSFCRERELPCVIVDEQTVDGIRVSSTHIRQLLEQGELATAVRFLGHPHILTGTVVPGRKLGRTIGIPTANLHLPEGLVVPKFGVYACYAVVNGKKYPAVTNIGTRPTVGGHHITVEPWILDFEGDLYGQQITLEFYHFLRPERKFDSLEALKQEICRNAEQTRLLLTDLQIGG